MKNAGPRPMKESSMSKRAIGSAAVVVVVALLGAFAIPKQSNPTELGLVKWGRDLDTALAESARTGKPVLLLFQEIPGCQTCQDFGTSPMSHPLLVEVIETEFVPLAIYNNRPGRDAEILAEFDERSWNFPVMRFVDAKGKDILPRREGIYDAGGVAKRLVEALTAAGREPPGYLRLAAAEVAPGRVAKATFAMHCFWEGEARLGAIKGVLGTRPGWVDGNEVVEVVFDPTVNDYGRLVKAAQSLDCAQVVYAHDRKQLAEATKLAASKVAPIEAPARDAKSSDQKYWLNRSELRHLPLTPMQATKVNADLRNGADPTRWLSPRQKAMLKQRREPAAPRPADPNPPPTP